MTNRCLSCNHSFKGNYCPNCGQKASVKRLTFSVLLHDLFHFFTHLENGFLFTTRSFLVKPGVSSTEYISGKRKKYQTPISYFFIWTSLYILIHNIIINHYHYELTGEIVTQMNIKEQSNIFFRQHFTLFIIPVLLLSSFLLYIIMAGSRYNFIEILMLSLFGTGTYFMMSFVTDFILGFIFKVNVLNANVFLYQGILSSVYNVWFSYDFFKRTYLPYFWLRLITVSVLIAIGGWLMMFYLPVAWLSWRA